MGRDFAFAKTRNQLEIEVAGELTPVCEYGGFIHGDEPSLFWPLPGAAIISQAVLTGHYRD
jgi:hypothetical protein